MAKFCASCGKLLQSENTDICPDCSILINLQPKLKPKKREGHGKHTVIIIGVVLLIGLAIGAMVFFYAALGQKFFTSEQTDGTLIVPTLKSQETVYKGVEQAAANVQIIGNVYGLTSTPSKGIDEIRFSIGLAPGAPSVDLTRMTIVFTKEGSNPVTYTLGTTASTGTFTSKINSGSYVNTLKANEPILIDFKVAAVKPNTRITMEIRPNIGASLPITRNTPALISAVNVLY